MRWQGEGFEWCTPAVVGAGGAAAISLRKQLAHDGGAGRIQWRSIFKHKGLEAEAAVITEVGDAAREFIAASGFDWDDLMHVGATRRKYRVVVVEGKG